MIEFGDDVNYRESNDFVIGTGMQTRLWMSWIIGVSRNFNDTQKLGKIFSPIVTPI